jgi:CheY-like chemotaxis protein
VIDTQPKTINVLLVEDDPGDVLMTREAFEEYLHNRLDVVTDGAAALSFLRHEEPYGDAPRPDLILLDLNLPKKNGLEVLEEIRHDPALRTTPVIMLTTSSSARDVAASYDRGVNCYVVKPLDLDDFTELVQAINGFWLEVARLPSH